MALPMRQPNGDANFTLGRVNGEPTWRSNTPLKQEFVVFGDQVYQRHRVDSIRMEYSDDPQIMCAEPIINWQQQSEKGQWIMKHGLDPTFHITEDFASYQCVIHITAHITPKRWTEFCLRWP